MVGADELERQRFATVPIALLLPGESPRSEGPDAEHVARLAELDAPLPPILVERRTMRVIDGIHRLMAAFWKGHEAIEVEFFDGTAEEAFLRAVEANITHGLPLSRADRRAAATRIIVSHPQMSDRAIARAAGLGAKAVAAIRRGSVDTVPQLHVRVGRDGKVRPLSSVEGRKRAAELIAEDPQASLREVARLAGISPATVSDVRRRLEAGQAPVADRSVQSAASDAATVSVPRQRTGRRMRPVPPDPATVLEKLLRDPALRHKEEGRHLLRLLQQNAVGMQDWSGLTSVVPTHCGDLVVDLARRCAEVWEEFAQELDDRVRSVGRV
ncbi:ParB N-terminal domain-containing protein [Kitasatospora nipponensis]|uniref:ParB N-terminal domain-containing protein n=1 Tax=Kitasatospora nipponensis TaxID=258049 RepID=A0ABN1VNG9_9ACTN